MAFSLPHQTKNGNNLSKLTKGIGEFFDEEKRIEIFLDQRDKEHGSFASSSKISAKQGSHHLMGLKQEISLPKTYTTR